ncbi:uncharacterized protein LOC126471151 [Schistocerca serialis cubense]|uniref:uncharacterized protein LOC126471151 n=1 Tax=Schistocerca serialis cubense TaxID=2023355 RepID=UPI00214EECE7|nr:uncharacterized protein LOC126471151 [Schistocerca serialis cubense]
MRSIQKAANFGDAKALYDSIKKAIGPTVRKTVPLKSKTSEVITDEGKKMECWVEHYLKFREIDFLANGKALGEDGIPAEVIKYNKSVLLKHLYSLITTSWEEDYVPMTLVSNTEDELQYIINKLSNAFEKFGLLIDFQKTKIMAQSTTNFPSISIDGNPLQVFDNFTYLESTICSNLSMDTEITNRIAKASSVMARLKNRIWNNGLLTTKTKLKVYNACVISTLLYSCETWTTLSRQESRLNSFHLCCLRKILQISWGDRVPNTEVFHHASTTSIFALPSHRRLRWLGHVRCMDPERILKQLLCGEL